MHLKRYTRWLTFLLGLVSLYPATAAAYKPPSRADHNYHSLLQVAVYYGSNGRVSQWTIEDFQLDTAHIEQTNLEFAAQPEFQKFATELGNKFSTDLRFSFLAVGELNYNGILYGVRDAAEMHVILQAALGEFQAADFATLFGKD